MYSPNLAWLLIIIREMAKIALKMIRDASIMMVFCEDNKKFLLFIIVSFISYQKNI